ncbi:pt repeat family [Pyrenophora seminiperda CCB06]|uniref:Pt repeat family n=1 Tax=Pyrenophora seminiperda CCB06 TaxID=1302712 RepID=A0A3M7M097_9PLEO|nr:pt repeat family [Pyrenophora seminiperda CCB06]
MANNATITFSQPGVQPPVYVTTSLTDWAPVEMDVDDEKTPDGDIVFRKHFSHASEGRHQYKIRIGQDHWVLDESKETATDDQGICNNVVQAQPPTQATPSTAIPDDTTAPEATTATPDATTAPETTNASESMTAPEETIAPEASSEKPTLIVSPELLEKKAHDRKDSVEEGQIHVSEGYAAHAEPVAEPVKIDSPVEPETPKSSDVPLVVVDKVDDKPAYGDDFSEDATTAQKAARDLRAADPAPDKLTITPEFHVEPGTVEEQASPLFHHESCQADETPLTPAMDTIDEESTQSSTDHTSSGDAMDTPSEQEEDTDELHLAPLLSHEPGSRDQNNKLEDAPLFPHETNKETGYHDDYINKNDHSLGPENAVIDDSGIANDSGGEDELDRYPLLSHESGFSDHKGSLATTEYDDLDDEEPQRYMSHDEYREDDGDTPLLPHERESAVVSDAGSTFSQDDTPFSLESQPTFGYENDRTKDLFGGSGRQDIFLTRTNSSKLPHRLPQSDAEDENLNDPSLERFPTNRDQIFERVASIGNHLPEDESMQNHPQSPQPSVLSQACSSVDLVAVKSYTSLASVPEADDSDEEDDEDEQRHDLESLPSPVYISQKHMRMPNPPSGFASDPNATPIVEEGKQLEQPADAHKSESSDAESIDKHDGANDVSRASNALHNVISRSVKTTDVVAEPDSELRQRRAPPTPTNATATAEDKVAKAVSASALAQQPENRNDNLFTHIFNAVFGRLGRFLTACVGDRKRASASAVVLGTTAAATYYYLGSSS